MITTITTTKRKDRNTAMYGVDEAFGAPSTALSASRAADVDGDADAAASAGRDADIVDVCGGISCGDKDAEAGGVGGVAHIGYGQSYVHGVVTSVDAYRGDTDQHFDGVGKFLGSSAASTHWG
jgi:hypothetical protein